MSTMRSTVHIDAPSETVFDFVDHWPNGMRYLKRLVRWEPINPDEPVDVGTVFRVGLQAGPTRLDGKLEVTERVRPERLRIRSLEGPGVTGGWTFTPEGNGTHVTLEARYDLPGGFAGRLVAAFISRNGQRDLDESLRELKRLIESGG